MRRSVALLALAVVCIAGEIVGPVVEAVVQVVEARRDEIAAIVTPTVARPSPLP
jgi:hypothetical protein